MIQKILNWLNYKVKPSNQAGPSIDLAKSNRYPFQGHSEGYLKWTIAKPVGLSNWTIFKGRPGHSL